MLFLTKQIQSLSLFFLLFCLAGNLDAEEKTVQLAQAPAFPVQNQLSTLSTLMRGKITLDLRNIEAVDALKFLAMKTGLNIVVTKSVAGRVSLTVQDAPDQGHF